MCSNVEGGHAAHQHDQHKNAVLMQLTANKVDTIGCCVGHIRGGELHSSGLDVKLFSLLFLQYTGSKPRSPLAVTNWCKKHTTQIYELNLLHEKFSGALFGSHIIFAFNAWI